VDADEPGDPWIGDAGASSGGRWLDLGVDTRRGVLWLVIVLAVTLASSIMVDVVARGG
jgi:hypothetical protein